MNNSEFLTEIELEALTGWKRPGKQLAWLAANGWVYATNAAQRPIVSRAYERMRLGAMAHDATAHTRQQPNFAALG